MKTNIKKVNGVSCAVVHSEEIIISDAQTALDFIATVRYETNCDRVSLNKEAISENFFNLSTGLAGEILQKFVNYRIKLAIVGEFGNYKSDSLRDFIYECNNGHSVFFDAVEEQALDKLSKV